MTLDTSWNVERYKTDYESEEHWTLRKKFMEVHKNKFPEDELVCLAQVFVNVEFMGCKYPDETMELVANLSQEVAKEYRNERCKRLKRTFVKASDAAEAKAKGKIVKVDVKSTPMAIENNFSYQEPNDDLFEGLRFGKFILFDCGDRNAIRMSGQKCGIKVEEKESVINDKKQVDTIINGEIVGTGCSTNIKEAKALSFETAIKKLRENCYIIKPTLNPDRIDIRKNDERITCNVKKSTEDTQKIDSTNIGFKIMQKLGWSGGGLGLKTKGIENPVDFLIKNNRKGLGNCNDIINANYFREMLSNYVTSEDIRDLHFESGFEKDERATLHQIASEKNLKSSSYGKEPNRYLVISKKTITPYKILHEVLINKNEMYINKYDVEVPKQKEHLFSAGYKNL